MNQFTININYSPTDQQKLDQILQLAINQTLAQWLSQNIFTLISDWQDSPKDISFTNPAVKNWQNKQLKNLVVELTNRITPHQPQQYPLTLTLLDTLFKIKPNLLSEVLERSYDHGTAFWTYERIANYMIYELVQGSTPTFKLPLTEDTQLNLEDANNIFNRTRIKILADAE